MSLLTPDDVALLREAQLAHVAVVEPDGRKYLGAERYPFRKRARCG